MMLIGGVRSWRDSTLVPKVEALSKGNGTEHKITHFLFTMLSVVSQTLLLEFINNIFPCSQHFEKIIVGPHGRNTTANSLSHVAC